MQQGIILDVARLLCFSNLREGKFLDTSVIFRPTEVHELY
jgi:hypothetical protein